MSKKNRQNVLLRIWDSIILSIVSKYYVIRRSAKLEYLVQVATIVIAIMATLGFIYSMLSSQELSDKLTKVEKGFSLYHYPLVKTIETQWAFDGEVNNCDNPPLGLTIRYGNVSNVALQVYESSFDIIYPEDYHELYPKPNIVGPQKGGQVLAPGEVITTILYNNEYYTTYLKGKLDPLETVIKIKVTINYSDITNSQRYVYSAVCNVGYSCTAPEITRSYIDEETVLEIKKTEDISTEEMD